MFNSEPIRERLVAIALEWEKRFGIAPAITSALSEYDAAILLGSSEQEFSKCLINQTAVTKGVDFIWQGKKYQVKANRPSGRPGSKVTLVALAKKDKVEKRYLWDRLIWILYDKHYQMIEAWQWESSEYEKYFDGITRVHPNDIRKGKQIYPNNN